MKKRRAKPGNIVKRRVRGEDRNRLGVVIAQPTKSRSRIMEEGALREVKTKPLVPVLGDDVAIEELQKAIRHMHGVDSHFVESVEVHETFNGETVWEGAVKVFDLIDHPQAKRAYAWSYATTGTKRRFMAALGVGAVDSPAMAVRAAIVADEKAKKN